ncbi:MAG TPA: hypothetical protein PLG21_10845, partial [Anaerolineae bacterium]|nr:hypothetical protein [Anaerolineae bacterium]
GATGMAVPACIVGGIGGLLYWQNATGRWGSWAYAWALIPGFAGVGLILAGLLRLNWRQVQAGLWQAFISLVVFGIFGSFFGGLGVLGRYWPALLILLGLALMVRAFLRPQRHPEAAEAKEASIPLGEAARARIRIKHGAGRLDVRAGAAPGELAGGSFGGGLDFRSERQDDLLDVQMQTPAQNIPGATLWDWQGTLDWACRLSAEVPLELDLEIGANEARLDLPELRVTGLKVKTGASSTTITLPAAAGYTHARVEAGAAEVKVRVPAGVAARIHVEGALAGVDVDSLRFPQAGGVYQSVDYDTAANTVEIDVSAAVGSVSVR